MLTYFLCLGEKFMVCAHIRAYTHTHTHTLICAHVYVHAQELSGEVGFEIQGDWYCSGDTEPIFTLYDSGEISAVTQCLWKKIS